MTKPATAARYRVTTRARWHDENDAEHWHEYTVIVKRYTGKRPKGRVYAHGDVWEHDELISESGRPPYIWAANIESAWHMVGPGNVPDDWEPVD
ncbi:hypothetical protein [Paraburkholderia bannensis]|uniref:hypothetical protein n=1 Tax=Paraburkholderia bannensis TaxID=765414 RepID=UPI002AC3364E|nr:hypothetical protein [Paraburkholderia bannensis]